MKNKHKNIILIRLNYNLTERKNVIYKYLYTHLLHRLKFNHNKISNNLTKQNLSNMITILFKLKILIVNNQEYLSKYKRFCILTKHSRSFKDLRFSRMTLKELIRSGSLSGFSKSSW